MELTTYDLTLITAGVGSAFSAVCALLAAFAGWPRQARHVAVAPARARAGADVTTPAAPWRRSPAPDTRPIRQDDGIPALVVDSPPGARGRIPVQGLPVIRKPSCTLCGDGVDVIGPVCVWCGHGPVPS